MRQRIAHEVDAATLPAGVEHLGDGGLDALVGIGHDQFDAAQAAAGELAQERRPECFGLGRANIDAENFTPARHC
jgi:Ni,Fe-hydrogenase III component G